MPYVSVATLPTANSSFPILQRAISACYGDAQLVIRVFETYLHLVETKVAKEFDNHKWRMHLWMWNTIIVGQLEANEAKASDLPDLSTSLPSYSESNLTSEIEEDFPNGDADSLHDPYVYRGLHMLSWQIMILESLRRKATEGVRATITRFIAGQIEAREEATALAEEDNEHGDEGGEEEEEDWQELEPGQMSDVDFEPAGQPLDASDYSTRVHSSSKTKCSICTDALDPDTREEDEAPMSLGCGHIFHFRCLSNLINGISQFSNLCPNCRVQICEPRARKAVNDDVSARVDAALLAEIAEDEGFDDMDVSDMGDDDEYRNIAWIPDQI
ncbi:hypothetical protein K504DRAFT_504038 [Pleomassaria siparia CBS 279.74]|uniref:RING-type domain-containing protein n=1 Tax=Pleomassaria siparia CBS 279.74 TaxID=1314801 RepID=A0A6G1K5L6_9PLEO|nr:hypothetical protein K504DRAFT_504038 [Pleomassaria siparia CBS 279.74]